MQSATPVAPQMPALASLLQLPMAATPVVGMLALTPTDFGDELAKLLAVAAPAIRSSDQAAALQDGPPTTMKTVVATVANPLPDATTQPQAAPDVAAQQRPIPVPTVIPASSPLPVPDPPIASPDGTPEATPGPRKAVAARRAPPTPAAPVAATPTDGPPASVLAPPPLPVATDVPAAVQKHADQPAQPAPRQHVTVPEPIAGIRATASAQGANTPAEAKPLDALPQPPFLASQTPPPAPASPSPPIDLTAAPPQAAIEPAQPTPPAEASAASAPPAHTAASPAAQLAPAIAQMGHAPDGAQRLTVRLDPPELGHVQVRIDRPPEAPARVEITVEKSDTLTLLLRDQPQLQRALDQAGVPPEGRSITFHVAASDPVGRTEPTTAPTPGVAAGGFSGDGSHGSPRQGNQPARHDTSLADTSDTGFTSIGVPGWVRAGLDITA